MQAKITAEREVTFSFDLPGNRELPLILGQLTVLPKHWWEGDDASGARRKIAATTLKPPLASGPYRIKRFEPGRTIVYERVKDYWGEDLNVRRGCNNFDELRFDYFRDLTSAFEAFKAGDLDWRVEYSAKTWATGYDFPALAAGRVVLEEFPVRNMGLMQAFAFNVRRPKFKNPQARRALNFAFDSNPSTSKSSTGNTSGSPATFKAPSLRHRDSRKAALARGPALKNLSRPKVEWGLIFSPAH